MGVIKAADPRALRARVPEIRIPALPVVVCEHVVVAARHELELRCDELAMQVEDLELEKAALEKTLGARVAELAEAADDLATAVVEAEARGRAAGLEEGGEAKAELLELLESACGRAGVQLRSDLKGMETLAVALARAALARVFGEDTDMGGRVARLVRRQLEGLERAAVLRVEVSVEDFPDASALDALHASAGLDGIEVKASDALGRGDCRLRLRLGELDVGLGQQWMRLSGLLDEALAEPESGA